MCTKKELPACPVETTLTMISDKWKVLILRDLLTGTKRFGELKKSLTGVSQKVLTSQLREMEENGLVERKAYPEVPPRVEYSLTPLGRSLQPIMDAMRVWANSTNNRMRDCAPGSCRTCGSTRHFLQKGETAPWSGSYCWRMTKVWSPG